MKIFLNTTQSIVRTAKFNWINKKFPNRTLEEDLGFSGLSSFISTAQVRLPLLLILPRIGGCIGIYIKPLKLVLDTTTPHGTERERFSFSFLFYEIINLLMLD